MSSSREPPRQLELVGCRQHDLTAKRPAVLVDRRTRLDVLDRPEADAEQPVARQLRRRASECAEPALARPEARQVRGADRPRARRVREDGARAGPPAAAPEVARPPDPGPGPVRERLV